MKEIARRPSIPRHLPELDPRILLLGVVQAPVPLEERDGAADPAISAVKDSSQPGSCCSAPVGRDFIIIVDLPFLVAIPMGVFYDSDAGDNLVRFAFCKQPTVLAEALTRLKDVER